jgi:hypothetical protein
MDSHGASGQSDDAAVIGVVVAGVLASFVNPGPFDLGGLLIGALLLAVLFAYTRWPEGRRGTTRRAVGLAAAVAFCCTFITGSLADQVRVGDKGQREYLFSGWPASKSEKTGKLPTREDGDVPTPRDGLPTLCAWLVFFGLSLGYWWRWPRRRLGAVAASAKVSA